MSWLAVLADGQTHEREHLKPHSLSKDSGNFVCLSDLGQGQPANHPAAPSPSCHYALGLVT